MLNAACQMGLEGVMAKRADAPYVSGRTETWLKLKCQQRQEFVIVGLHRPVNGARKEVGGLLLGYHEAGELRYAGSVGTGWGSATGREMHEMLSKLEVNKPAVIRKASKPGRWSKRAAGSERWVKPTMVVEVAFSEWTPDGHVGIRCFAGLSGRQARRPDRRERATEHQRARLSRRPPAERPRPP
jgi:bifunctional non-homologous end joining protein LigD